MTRLPLTLLSVATLVAGLASGANAQELSSLNTPLMTIGGESTTVARLGEGKVTVVTFWMTNCRASKHQLDQMRALVDELKDQVEFLAVSIDNTKTMSKVGPLVASKGYSSTILLDPNRDLFDLVGGSEHPYTLVFGADGQLKARNVGFLHGDEEVIGKTVKGLLGSTKESSSK